MSKLHREMRPWRAHLKESRLTEAKIILLHLLDEAIPSDAPKYVKTALNEVKRYLEESK